MVRLLLAPPQLAWANVSRRNAPLLHDTLYDAVDDDAHVPSLYARIALRSAELQLAVEYVARPAKLVGMFCASGVSVRDIEFHR